MGCGLELFVVGKSVNYKLLPSTFQQGWIKKIILTGIEPGRKFN